MTASRRPVPAATLVAPVALALGVTLAACSSPAGSMAGSSAGPAAATTAAPTSASTSAAPVVVEELAKGSDPSAVDVAVAGPAQVVFRRITIRPGGGTGLHCHDGQLLAVVEQGQLTHYAPIYPGGVHVYSAGDTVLEGAHYVHQGKNEGTQDVVLLVTYVIAQGKPLAQTDLSQCSAT